MNTTKQLIVAQLNNILPTQYEMFVDGKQTLPLITYIESRNTDNIVGDTIVYSDVVYRIKLWVETVEDMETYCQQIDTCMKTLNFKRTYCTEIHTDNMICKVMDYQCRCIENL